LNGRQRRHDPAGNLADALELEVVGMKSLIRYIIAVFIAVLCAFAVVECVGCAPIQFKTGQEVAPPYGCVEARKRGHDC
jgi:hypothetical protein